MYIQVNLPDTYGPTVTEAMSAVDASFDTWRREHLRNHQWCVLRVSQFLVAYRLGGSRVFVL